MATRKDAPSPDPDDLASRNARNPERTDQPDDDEEEDDEDTEEECYDSALYDEDGNVTEAGAARVAAASYALPGKSKLPIHTRAAVKDSMRKFAAYQFDSPDEKHAAFNRLIGKADQFGVSATRFRRSHAATLDRKDNEDMLDAETRIKAGKADKYKTERNEARQRADKAEQDLAAANGKIASLETDVTNLKAEAGKRTDAAEVEFTGRVNAKTELVAKAISLIGIRKDSSLDGDIKHYSAMSEGDVQRAIIKHVDKRDVAADEHPMYVRALFDGAVARATADAAAVAAGAQALAGVRAATVVPTLPVTGQLPAGTNVPHADAADLDDEHSAAKRARERAAKRAYEPSRMTKDSAIAQINGTK